jgi:AcrR family transcriptional regulator
MKSGKQETVGMKQRILNAAVVLFSEQNYDKVTTRDIAKAVGIKAASLYSHFASKDELLTRIYALYEEKAGRVRPDLDALLKLAETEPPVNVLMKTGFFFNPEDQEIMDRIVVIAALESRADKRSEDFLIKNIVNLPRDYTVKLLKRMLELGRIEPMDVEAFAVLQSNLCYSAALRNFSNHPVTLSEWNAGVDLLYTLVKPTEG